MPEIIEILTFCNIIQKYCLKDSGCIFTHLFDCIPYRQPQQKSGEQITEYTERVAAHLSRYQEREIHKQFLITKLEFPFVINKVVSRGKQLAIFVGPKVFTITSFGLGAYLAFVPLSGILLCV